MNARLLAEFEALLRGERTRLSSLLTLLEQPAGDSPSPGEEGDPGSLGAGKPDDPAIAAREAAALAEINAALTLIRDTPDLYGVCAVCGRPIAKKRLELVPATRFCERHATSKAVTAA